MGYRISYGKSRRRRWYWVLLPVAAGLALMGSEGWYEAFARYVGAAIRGH